MASFTTKQLDLAVQTIKNRVSHQIPNLPPPLGEREERRRQDKVNRLHLDADLFVQQKKWDQARQAYQDAFYINQSEQTKQDCAQRLYQLLQAMAERASERSDLKVAENIKKTVVQLMNNT